jgi:hypothetical protein
MRSADRPLRWPIPVALGLCCLVFALLGLAVAEADASPLEAAVPGPQTSIPESHAEEVSGTSAAMVYLECEATSGTVVEDHYTVHVAGVEILDPAVKGTADKTTNAILAVSFLVPAGKTYEWATHTGSFAGCEASTQLVTGGEGKEGHEGKEGKEGLPGAEGKEGKATGTKVESFGASAESELDGDTEAMNVTMFVLIGVVLAAMMLMVYRAEVSHRA